MAVALSGRRFEEKKSDNVYLSSILGSGAFLRYWVQSAQSRDSQSHTTTQSPPPKSRNLKPNKFTKLPGFTKRARGEGWSTSPDSTYHRIHLSYFVAIQ